MPKVEIVLPETIDYTTAKDAPWVTARDIADEVRTVILAEVGRATATVVEQLLKADASAQAAFFALVKARLDAVLEDKRLVQTARNAGLIVNDTE